MEILFVCSGNIGRSQIAEAIFNKLAEGKHAAFSAAVSVYGKDGSNREGLEIQDLDPARQANVIESLKSIGIDISSSVIKQVTSDKVDKADKVIVMSEVTLPDFLKNDNKILDWQVEDTKYKNQRETDTIRDQIVQKVKELLLDLNS